MNLNYFVNDLHPSTSLSLISPMIFSQNVPPDSNFTKKDLLRISAKDLTISSISCSKLSTQMHKKSEISRESYFQMLARALQTLEPIPSLAESAFGLVQIYTSQIMISFTHTNFSFTKRFPAFDSLFDFVALSSKASRLTKQQWKIYFFQNVQFKSVGLPFICAAVHIVSNGEDDLQNSQEVFVFTQ